MAIIKTRKIKLIHSNNDNIEKTEQILNNLKGVKEFNYNQPDRILTISYDLELVMLIKIEEILQKQGIQIDNTFFEKMKRGWNHYTEQNELDNLHLNPSCCSNPKAIMTKTKQI